MNIKGLTDSDTIQAKANFVRTSVTVFKGSPKEKVVTTQPNGETYTKERMGRDLKNLFRLRLKNPLLKRILEATYGKPNKDGDYHTETIRLYLLSDDMDRLCPTVMASYKNGKKFLASCDRVNVFEKGVEFESPVGLCRSRIKTTEACTAAGKPLSYPCKYNCKPIASLYFYIRELMDADYLEAAVLHFTALQDMTPGGLLYQLHQLKEELGSLTQSPFLWYYPHPSRDGSEKVSNRIPFILSRAKVAQNKPVIKNGKRTGATFEEDSYPLILTVDPVWYGLYKEYTCKASQAIVPISTPTPPVEIYTAPPLARSPQEKLTAKYKKEIGFLCEFLDIPLTLLLKKYEQKWETSYEAFTEAQLLDLMGSLQKELGVRSPYYAQIQQMAAELSEEISTLVSKYLKKPSLGYCSTSELETLIKCLSQELDRMNAENLDPDDDF